MSQLPFFASDYRPHFTGHETFPLRYGWLKKTFEEVITSDYSKDNRFIFKNDDAIARFGVGKNMVSSMRHWATSVGILTDDHKTGIIQPTFFGKEIFGTTTKNGLDPYLENLASLWLIHWKLCSQEKKTTWHYVFNFFPSDHFDRDHIVSSLETLTKDRGWGRTSTATIKRDVECFVRSYVAKPLTNKTTPEDTLESPLSELGLIKATGKRDGFRLVRGSKPTLGNGVFLYALVDFWTSSRFKNVNQLPFESIVYDPGSPGRVFLLDENELATRLMQIDDYTNGVLSWSETSGIKSIIKNAGQCFSEKDNRFQYIHCDYR